MTSDYTLTYTLYDKLRIDWHEANPHKFIHNYVGYNERKNSYPLSDIEGGVELQVATVSDISWIVEGFQYDNYFNY